ncbi:MAG: hypothetical protein BWY56_02615 [Acidobacteria bacterium ADurb.Bin340]|nr:MAG: hypothetical protein BWY56_02615 [Acidobacteria bacterium ADurb.Bin340]
MCAGLAALAGIWGILAILAGGWWATLILGTGFLGLAGVAAAWEGFQTRRRAAWIASGEANACLERLETALGRLAGDLGARLDRPMAAPLPGASLPRTTVLRNLAVLGRTAERTAQAVNHLGRALAGACPIWRMPALQADLIDAVAPALAEMEGLQALRVRPEDTEGLRLLVAIFKGLLRQIADWAALGRERLRAARIDLGDGRSAQVDLPLELVPPPECQGLQAWLRARGWQEETDDPPRSHPSQAVPSALIAGLAAGYLFGNHSSGSKDGR